MAVKRKTNVTAKKTVKKTEKKVLGYLYADYYSNTNLTFFRKHSDLINHCKQQLRGKDWFEDDAEISNEFSCGSGILDDSIYKIYTDNTAEEIDVKFRVVITKDIELVEVK